MPNLHPTASMDEIACENNQRQIAIFANWLEPKLGVAVATYQEEDFLEEVMG